MSKNNISLCLFTSTKGHFDQSTFKETVENWLSYCPADGWGQLLAHVKVSPGESGEGIAVWLRNKGFDVRITDGEWKHNDNSHHAEYLSDLGKMSLLVDQEYVIMVEDDWLLSLKNLPLSYFINFGQTLLKKSPQLLEVRFPRFNNEVERIKKLKEKHGINAYVLTDNNKTLFWHSENANLHPCIRRSRDVMIALKLLKDNWASLSRLGVEQGFSLCFKSLSYDVASLGCFYPEAAQVLHIGVRTPEERDVEGQVFDR